VGPQPVRQMNGTGPGGRDGGRRSEARAEASPRPWGTSLLGTSSLLGDMYSRVPGTGEYMSRIRDRHPLPPSRLRVNPSGLRAAPPPPAPSRSDRAAALLTHVNLNPRSSSMAGGPVHTRTTGLRGVEAHISGRASIRCPHGDEPASARQRPGTRTVTIRQRHGIDPAAARQPPHNCGRPAPPPQRPTACTTGWQPTHVCAMFLPWPRLRAL
jgi:hypothetical protein